MKGLQIALILFAGGCAQAVIGSNQTDVSQASIRPSASASYLPTPPEGEVAAQQGHEESQVPAPRGFSAEAEVEVAAIQADAALKALLEAVFKAGETAGEARAAGAAAAGLEAEETLRLAQKAEDFDDTCSEQTEPAELPRSTDFDSDTEDAKKAIDDTDKKAREAHKAAASGYKTGTYEQLKRRIESRNTPGGKKLDCVLVGIEKLTFPGFYAKGDHQRKRFTVAQLAEFSQGGAFRIRIVNHWLDQEPFITIEANGTVQQIEAQLIKIRNANEVRTRDAKARGVRKVSKGIRQASRTVSSAVRGAVKGAKVGAAESRDSTRG